MSSSIDEAIRVGKLAQEYERTSRLTEVRVGQLFYFALQTFHFNSQAKDHFAEAAGLFLKAMKDELHPKRKELLKAQAMNFLERAEHVRVF